MNSALKPDREGRPRLDFRTLFASLPGMYLVLHPDPPTYTVAAANEAYARATFMPAREIAGRGLFELFRDRPSAQYAPGMKELQISLQQVLDTQAVHATSARKYGLSHPNQAGVLEDRYWSSVNAPLLDADGRVQFIIHHPLRTPGGQVNGSARELHEGDARFSVAFAEAPIGMVLTTPAGVLLDINQSYMEMLGYSREELTGRDSAHMTHPDDIGPTRQLFASLQRGPVRRASIEKRYFRKDGEMLWARLTATLQTDSRGNPVRVITVAENITKRKLAEMRLRESQERLRAIFDSTYEYIALLTPGGTVLEANRAALDLFENSREQVAGRPFWDTPWFTPTPDVPATVQLGVARAATGRPVRDEIVLRRPSGEFGTFEVSLYPVRNEEAGIIFILAEGRDITQAKKMELRDAFLVRLDDATRPLVDPDKIMEMVSQLLGEHLRADCCAYCAFEPDQDAFEVRSDFVRPGVASVAGRYKLSQFGVEGVLSLRRNEPFVIENIETDPRTADAWPAYRAFGITSAVSMPLHKDGLLVASMFVHQQTGRRWLPEEVELLRLTANRCWESIERARVARALRASERWLRLAQRAGRIGSFEWLIKEDRMVLTPEMAALYGIAESELGASFKDWRRRLVPDDAERVTSLVVNSLAHHEAECAYEFRAVLPGGDLRWLRTQAQFFYDAAGKPERMVGVNIDIDAQKLAELHLRQQWHTFDTALSHTPDYIYTLDLEGRVAYANRALLSLWQKPLEEAVGKTVLELGVQPELAARLKRQVQQVIDTKQPLRDQMPFTARNGETRYFEYIFVPVFAEDGHVEAVTASTRDITEQKAAAEQERERQEQLRESARLESLGVMAGGIAHDFNNLLTGILGNATLLVEDLGGKGRSMAGEIVLAAERAADLTRQMLAFSGKGRFFIELLDLNTLIQENLTLLRASLSRNVSVELDLHRAPCVIEADRGQVQQVIMNLLINASEAVGDLPGTVTVRTGTAERAQPQSSTLGGTLVPPGTYCLLEVSDTGSGMGPETQKKMFDPFFTTKFTGRGLGLAAVLGIVKGHVGDIEVFSKLGLGTTFRILLPAAAQASLSRKEEASPAAARLTGQTVLVADDEGMVRKMAAAGLESRGFRVMLAENGLEAVDILRAHPGISLVILDLTMPVMTGEQALPLIQAIDPEVPIILSSGFSEAEIWRRFGSAGIAGVLQKPYGVSALIAKVTQGLKRAA